MFKWVVNIRPLNDGREFPKSAAGQIIYSRLSVHAYRTCVNARGTGKREGPTRQGVMKVPCFSLKWPPNRQDDGVKILPGLWGILSTIYDKKKLPVHARARRYDVIRSTASDRFSIEIVFSAP